MITIDYIGSVADPNLDTVFVTVFLPIEWTLHDLLEDILEGSKNSFTDKGINQ